MAHPMGLEACICFEFELDYQDFFTYVYSYLSQDKFLQNRQVCVSNSKLMVLRIDN